MRASPRGALRAPLAVPCLLALAALLLPVVASGQETAQQPTPLAWQAGPMTAPIGDGLAEIDLGEGYVFLGAAETQRLLELNQNPVDGSELATVAPMSEEVSWFVIFEWSEMGWVSDEDQDDLDADSILESIRQGTEASNEARRARGWPTMSIVGWQEEPHYDWNTKNLTWAIIGESGGGRNVNRLTKLLGRRGVMSATLVASPDELFAASAAVDELLTGYRFQKGSTYAEYIPGTDRLAEVGLTALVVGGAGAALVKSGLLARFWKPIGLGLVALGVGIKRMFMGGRSSKHDPEKPIG
jgi:uncharacterized membrane-anchored protein